MEDDADLREQLFHNTVRENIVRNESILYSFNIANRNNSSVTLSQPLPRPQVAIVFFSQILCLELVVGIQKGHRPRYTSLGSVIISSPI